MADHVPPSAPVNDTLVLAMVGASDAPLLLLDGDLEVIAASQSFCRAFDVAPAGAPGRSMFELGGGEWDTPQLRSLLVATVSGQAAVDGYEMDFKSAGEDPRHLVIKAQKLDYSDARLLVTVSDITDARLAEKLKDDLLREKAVLLQEVQHRVANSLQIIASVLLQSARNVQSEESRSHLHDAHSRVMSIAAASQQLSVSSQRDVALRPYFTQLCRSLGASMIRDHGKLSIEVSGDASRVAGDQSVSLGLIVTELVINALKHAFPENRPGKILVDYRSRGPNWTLSVSDDGVGMPPNAANVAPGLGTSIIEALARQLHARVTIADRKPGTAVSIVHTRIAVVDGADSVGRAV